MVAKSSSRSVKSTPIAAQPATLTADDIITYLLIFCLVVLLCYTLFYLYNVYYASPSSKENFAEAKTVRIIGMSGCGWTQKQVPEWDKVVKGWTNPSITLVPDVCMVDQGSECRELGKEFEVQSYPTLVVLGADGKTLVSKHPGYKSSEALITFIAAL